MKKIADVPSILEQTAWYYKDRPPCLHPEHNPPTNIVLDPGVYEHECPSCGHSQIVTIGRITLNGGAR